jgi:hypothetical protein
MYLIGKDPDNCVEIDAFALKAKGCCCAAMQTGHDDG